MEMERDTAKYVPKIGYAYVKDQIMESTYPPEKALADGTIFPQLNISAEEYQRGLYNGRR